MRKAIFAVAALCPIVLHAQANSPAHTPSAGTPSVLESRLVAPPVAKAVAASSDAGSVARTSSARISTGVTFPKLLETARIVESTDWHWSASEAQRQALVRMVVDTHGVPTNVQIVHGLGGRMDGDLLASVSKYRFTPGALNHQAVPIEVDLTVTIEGR